ncbi:MAG: hypothetical protein AB1486_20425 [Planctomycetota bacterium]
MVWPDGFLAIRWEGGKRARPGRAAASGHDEEARRLARQRPETRTGKIVRRRLLDAVRWRAQGPGY